MEHPLPFSIQDAMRIAQSPAGQQLIELLRRQNGTDLDQAITNAKSGDYDSAKNALSSALNTPEVQELLRQLGR